MLHILLVILQLGPQLCQVARQDRMRKQDITSYQLMWKQLKVHVHIYDVYMSGAGVLPRQQISDNSSARL